MTADHMRSVSLEQGITGIGVVEVTLFGSSGAVCDADGVTSAVTFTHNPGNVPGMRLVGVTLSSGGQPAGAASVVLQWRDGGDQLGSQGGKAVDGTRELVPCSNRYVCRMMRYSLLFSSVIGLPGLCVWPLTTSSPRNGLVRLQGCLQYCDRNLHVLHRLPKFKRCWARPRECGGYSYGLRRHQRTDYHLSG